MAKRKAIGRDPLAWIGESEPGGQDTPLRSDDASETPVQATAGTGDAGGFQVQRIAKFNTYEVLTARLRGDQIDFLNDLERRIMRNRSQKRQRITKNSLLRAAVDMLHMLDFDAREIGDEEELRRRILDQLESN